MSNSTEPPVATKPPSPPTFAEAFRFWLKLGFISFGGPTGQIAIMHTELVERSKWISEDRFLHALNYCMLLPGPEAQQLATYTGWLLHGVRGGIVAGTLFVLPSALLLWLLCYVYVTYGQVAWIGAVFAGLKPAVIAIVAAAVIRIGRKALRNAAMWTLAATAFVAIYFFHAPFPAIVLSAGLIGLIGSRLAPNVFAGRKPGADHASKANQEPIDTIATTRHPATLARAIRVLAVCLALWWAPPLTAFLLLGSDHAVSQQALFYSKAAMVTFGGAYAVLPYVAQQAVERFDWLAPGQMLDGLGLAETTPGPLIIVVQFVGFIGAWRHPGSLSPLFAATLGAAMTTWVTFLPCFLWIFLGAPYVESLRSNARLSAALSAITASVVGVVLNLAIWFALHVILPSPGMVDWKALAIAIMAFVALVGFKVDMLIVIAAAAAIGLAI